jgi:hypothetical protein
MSYNCVVFPFCCILLPSVFHCGFGTAIFHMPVFINLTVPSFYTHICRCFILRCPYASYNCVFMNTGCIMWPGKMRDTHFPGSDCFSSRSGSSYLFLCPAMCAYNFIRMLIFFLPKPWLLHTNTPMLYDKLRGTAVGVLYIVKGVGRGERGP